MKIRSTRDDSERRIRLMSDKSYPSALGFGNHGFYEILKILPEIVGGRRDYIVSHRDHMLSADRVGVRNLVLDRAVVCRNRRESAVRL